MSCSLGKLGNGFEKNEHLGVREDIKTARQGGCRPGLACSCLPDHAIFPERLLVEQVLNGSISFPRGVTCCNRGFCAHGFLRLCFLGSGSPHYRRTIAGLSVGLVCIGSPEALRALCGSRAEYFSSRSFFNSLDSRFFHARRF